MWDSESKRKLIDIINRAKVIETKPNWYSLHRIWHNPDTRSDFYELFLAFWKEELTDVNACVLLCPEGLVSSFGMIPFASLLANELKHSLVVWEEFGDILTASPLMYPNESFLEKGKCCIVLQDVVSKGSTLRKLYNELNRLGWKIRRYVTLVQIDEYNQDLEDNINYCRNNLDYLTEDFRFIPILHDTEIRGKN